MLKATRFGAPLLCAAFLAAISCNDKKAIVAVIPDVNVVAAAQRSLPVYSEFIGQTYGQSDIDIQPRVEGWITSINFKEGDHVEKDQLLYTIDDVQLQNRVESSHADVIEAQVMVQ